MLRTLVVLIDQLAPALYAGCGLGAVLFFMRILEARRLRRAAVFGLEREDLHRRLRCAGSGLSLLLLMMAGVWLIENRLAPGLSEGQAAPAAEEGEATPGLEVAVLPPTPTRPALLFPTVTPTPGFSVDAPPTPTPGGAPVDGCQIFGQGISAPASGEPVSGQVGMQGSSNILGFSQYKFEIAGEATGGQWVVVGTYRQPVTDGILGTWDSTSLPGGAYQLRLVTFRADGSYITPCEITVEVVNSAPAAQDLAIPEQPEP